MRHPQGSLGVCVRFISSIATRRFLGTTAILLVAGVMTKPAWATSVSFAQFSEANPGGNLFAYLDNGSASTAQFGTLNGTFGAAIPANFTFLNLGTLPADLTGNQAATISMTSTTTSSVLSTPIPLLGITLGSQQFPTVASDTISIIRNTPAAEGNGTRTNLLTVTFTGQLLGTLTGRTPQYSADTGLGFTVNYSSDFLTFNNSLEKDFSMTFSSWASNSNANGLSLSTLASDLYFAAATASGAGTFDGTVSFVPEPATWLLGIISAAMLVLTARHLTREQKALAECRVKA